MCDITEQVRCDMTEQVKCDMTEQVRCDIHYFTHFERKLFRQQREGN